MPARGTLTTSMAWSVDTAGVALAAGSAVALLSDGSPDAAPDVAFTMAVMAGSLYWSMIILSLRTDAEERPRFAALVRAHVRYTLRTSAVAVAGVLSVGAAGALHGLGAPPPWPRGANALAFAAFLLMMLRVLAIVGSFPEILEARLEADDAPEDKGEPETPRRGRLAWRRPAPHRAGFS